MLQPADLRFELLTPELWPAIVQLFGDNGACGGCWCMFWRVEKGERYADVRGAPARRRFKRLVLDGKAHGVLAFAADEPVGWCAFQRRVELPRLDRAPSLRIADADRVWSLPCFFIKPGWRGRGVATQLLAAAERALRDQGAEVLEAYPVLATPERKLANTDAYTGVTGMFEAAGFECAAARPRGKQRYRKQLPSGARRPSRPGRRG
jgi:GNAT superfamily N-acetyltransferase